MKQRIEYIDTAKGILILLVIAGHTLGESFFTWWIFTFHMPAFFIISGILFNYSSFLTKSLNQAIHSLAKTLIIPYFIFEILGAITDFLINGYTLNPIGYVYNSLTLNYNNIVDWFLIHLFAAELIFWFIHNKFKNKSRIGALIILIVTISFTLSNKAFLQTFCRIGISLAFLALGYYFHELFENKKIWIFITSLIITLILTHINGRVGMLTMRYGNPLLYVICATLGSLFILCTGNIFQQIHFFKFCGKHSLIIMGIHVPVNLMIRKFLPYELPLYSVFLFIAVSAISISIAFLIQQLRKRKIIRH